MSSPPVIAIVDDDEDIRDAFSNLLQALGYSCQAFDGARAFLKANSPGRFDCLITDIRMPSISGLELIQHLKAAGEALPVIVITSVSDPAVRRQALAFGALAYLQKPITDEALLESLRTALPPGDNAPDDQAHE